MSRGKIPIEENEKKKEKEGRGKKPLADNKDE